MSGFIPSATGGVTFDELERDCHVYANKEVTIVASRKKCGGWFLTAAFPALLMNGAKGPNPIYPGALL